MVAMPWGYYHPDTHDFMTSIYYLKAHHHWAVHGKTTFLTPLLYALAFFVPKVPALILIPLAQHLRGLLVVLMVGGLCRLWCVFWRWLIVPITVLAAIQPRDDFLGAHASVRVRLRLRCCQFGVDRHHLRTLARLAEPGRIVRGDVLGGSRSAGGKPLARRGSSIGFIGLRGEPGGVSSPS